MGCIAQHKLAALLVVALVATIAVGCDTTDGDRTKIVVPSAATSAPEYRGNGEIPEQRYVIRMSDGERDWEVEFPSVATGYEMHIPLESRGRRRGGGLQWQGDSLTEADRQLLRRMRRQNPQMEREGVYRGGQNVLDKQRGREGSGGGPRPGAGQQKKGRQNGSSRGPTDQQQSQQSQSDEARGDQQPRPGLSKRSKSNRKGDQRKRKRRPEAAPAPSRPSYLLGLQKVRRLYRNGNYEVALVRLVKLEEAYPNDEQILSMKGTLWLKLGRPKLARKAWERVLQINQENEKVRKALQRLNKQNNASE